MGLGLYILTIGYTVHGLKKGSAVCNIGMKIRIEMNITAVETDTALKSVLQAGDDVLIHAALSPLGHFEAGVEALVESICDAVTESGTVVMMTDSRSFARTGEFSLSQPSETGLLTEAFRKKKGVLRSCVPMASFCAWGARAQEYTQPYHSHLDNTATITRLLENDGKIMLMGIGYEKCTLYHLAEERHQLPYNFYKEFSGVLRHEDGSTEPISQRYFVRKDMAVKKDPAIAGKMLEERGQERIQSLGDDVMRVFKARDFDQCCMDALQADKNAFLLKA